MARPSPAFSDVGPTSTPWRNLASAATVTGIAFGVGAALGSVMPRERSPQPDPKPTTVESTTRGRASSDELAILSPLREGGTLEGFEVAEIEAIGNDGVLRVIFKKVGKEDGGTVRLEVALVAEGGPPPPALAGRYGVFYALEGAGPADGERLALALAAVLQANANLPSPSALAPFAARRP